MDERHEELMVTIRCLAYNHEPYIRQCLEGFVIQKTNFRFEAIVHDDASTDGTAAIIREYAEKYPDIIKPIFETENQYSKRNGSIRRIMNEHTHGKYVALCEGDDYWVDPMKLQKQVDFLEKNPEYVLSHTGFEYLQDGIKSSLTGRDKVNTNLSILNSEEDLRCAILDGNRYVVQTVSVVIRENMYRKALNELEECRHKFMMGDTPLWVTLLSFGRFHFLSDVTSYYRLHINSACHKKSLKEKLRFDLSCMEMSVYMSKKYNLPEIVKNKFQKKYNKCLVKYLWFDVSYQPFIEVVFTTKSEEILFNILKHNTLTPIFRFLYRKRNEKKIGYVR